MFYIIGTKEQRDEFMREHRPPYFEFEEQLDHETVQLYNYEDERATLYINLTEGERFTVQRWDAEACAYAGEEDYTSYIEALEAYYEAEEGEA